MNSLVFVYGTLKKGFSNHRLLAGSEYLGTAQTVEKYAMYSTGTPIVLKDEAVSPIHGELYRVNEATLVALDSLEGHPDWYRREEISIFVDGEKGRYQETAWLYFSLDRRGVLVPEGKFLKEVRRQV
ncbi:MAG: gamma-glutamylcyclotransferase [Desulfobulbaceae bacterium]|nr:MAG: gamma-glutamylcyclotransferase [Desulfobulbaceae bacterium]